jgi:hypothetical protein
LVRIELARGRTLKTQHIVLHKTAHGDFFNQFETGGLNLSDNDFLSDTHVIQHPFSRYSRNPFEIDDRELPPRAQGIIKTGQHRNGILEVMVGVGDKSDIDGGVGQFHTTRRRRRRAATTKPRHDGAQVYFQRSISRPELKRSNSSISPGSYAEATRT